MDTSTALVIGRLGGHSEAFCAVHLDAAGTEISREQIARDDLTAWVAAAEAAAQPRWVVRSLREFYPRLLAAGIRLRRAHDLLLCHAILRDTALLAVPLPASPRWVRRDSDLPPDDGLFSFLGSEETSAETIDDLLSEYASQRAALTTAPDGRLALLCAAESTGALIAEELTAAGLPWDVPTHQRILVETLGERPMAGGTPRKMAALAQEIRQMLDDPTLNVDSPSKVLRALHRVGIQVESTSRWLLSQHEHPVIEPLIAYKKLARLLTANGWAWLSDWIAEGRFRPIYITGGVVTGRWSSSGGGALQIPRDLRSAVHADDGWLFVLADVAQLEPRVLAAMAHDTAMADAGRGTDLYEGVVRSGAVATREEAKYAVLGAMYGATSGESGRLVPKLRAVYPRAMGLVDEAARTGEQGGTVSTRLGRSSPPPAPEWLETQAGASHPEATTFDERRAGSSARERGRFTRNFVVQGTAAEWALLWLAEIRHRLGTLPDATTPAVASGPVFATRAHLAFFLHDEVIVHAPQELAEDVARIVAEAAAAATTRLFQSFPIDIPLDLHVVQTADK